MHTGCSRTSTITRALPSQHLHGRNLRQIFDSPVCRPAARMFLMSTTRSTICSSCTSRRLQASYHESLEANLIFIGWRNNFCRNIEKQYKASSCLELVRRLPFVRDPSLQRIMLMIDADSRSAFALKREKNVSRILIPQSKHAPRWPARCKMQWQLIRVGHRGSLQIRLPQDHAAMAHKSLCDNTSRTQIQVWPSMQHDGIHT